MEQETQRVVVLNARSSFSSALETSSHQSTYSGELILHCPIISCCHCLHSLHDKYGKSLLRCLQ